MGRTRLLNLVGSGGCGKTRLAIETARQLLNDHPDGAWFVDLSVIVDGQFVFDTVARSLGVGGADEPAERMVIRWLANRSALIVLDNCEHVVGSVAAAAELLVHQCPLLRVLATSREPLRVEDEWIYRVPSLAIPTRRLAPPTDLRHVESVRLFLDRARQADSSFELSDRNAEAVSGICARLDGIPLALELAAGCIASMSPQLILERLEERFNLLLGGHRTAAPRHRTLRAAVEWSDGLLSEAERRLFRRIAVFVGDFDLDAVERVVTDPELPSGIVLPLLGSLVDRSLVAFLPEDPRGRYRLLETLRAFALERLEAEEGADRFRAMHAAYYIAIASRWFEAWWTWRPFDHIGDRDADNFLAALEYGSHLTPPDFAGLARTVHLLRSQGLLNVARAYQWTETFLQRAPPDPLVSFSLQFGVGKLSSRRGELQLARRHLELALGACEKLEDTHGLVRILLELSMVAGLAGDREAAVRHGTRSVELARELDHPAVLAFALNGFGWALLTLPDAERALAVAEDALSIARLLREPDQVGYVLDTLALAHLHRGEVAVAVRLELEALQCERRTSWDTVAKLATMAALRSASGQPERCLRLAGAIDAWREQLGHQVDPEFAIYKPWFDAAARALGTRATAVRTSGRGLSLEEAWAYALEELGAEQSEDQAEHLRSSQPEGRPAEQHEVNPKEDQPDEEPDRQATNRAVRRIGPETSA
jgi:non-specific serine/threonine protein kinase